MGSFPFDVAFSAVALASPVLGVRWDSTGILKSDLPALLAHQSAVGAAQLSPVR